MVMLQEKLSNVIIHSYNSSHNYCLVVYLEYIVNQCWNFDVDFFMKKLYYFEEVVWVNGSR